MLLYSAKFTIYTGVCRVVYSALYNVSCTLPQYTSVLHVCAHVELLHWGTLLLSNMLVKHEFR
jgi:hypothetical protein